MFKFYINMGNKVIKIHSIWRFTQSLWLAKYIELNTQKRTVAKSAFKNDLYNLKNNTYLTSMRQWKMLETGLI